MIDLRDAGLPADAVREALGLAPHPEGGHFREIWRDPGVAGTRGAGTSILFLLAAGERSHWHRVDAAEVWLWQAGSPLELAVHAAQRQTVRLGPAMLSGELLQAVVPVMAWQAARSLGDWSLMSCVVAPAFDFAGFEIAPEGWEPQGSKG